MGHLIPPGPNARPTDGRLTTSRVAGVYQEPGVALLQSPKRGGACEK